MFYQKLVDMECKEVQSYWCVNAAKFNMLLTPKGCSLLRHLPALAHAESKVEPSRHE